MKNIDYIMGLLDWNNPSEMQLVGRRLAQDVHYIHVFLQPCSKKINKNVWDNCALILSERTDEELSPYLDDLFAWLQDMNWPGAFCIFERLKRFKRTKQYDDKLQDCIHQAQILGDESWLNILQEL